MKNIDNSEELRKFLATELKKVCSGDSTPAMANAAANLSGKIISSVNMELQYCRMTQQIPYIDFIKIPAREEIKKLDIKEANNG